jgi:hypothetical protein
MMIPASDPWMMRLGGALWFTEEQEEEEEQSEVPDGLHLPDGSGPVDLGRVHL